MASPTPDQNDPKNPGPDISQRSILRSILPYLWPQDRRDLRVRVVFAIAMLIIAKLINVTVPFALKQAVDMLSLSQDVATPFVMVLGVILAYGTARILAQVFGEIRDALFSRVSQNAVRKVALTTFRHIHALSLRFHLERQTGGLSRAIDRGTKGIEFLLSFLLFSILPTLFEILLVAGLLWWLFDFRFTAIVLVTIAAYIFYTIRLTEWRMNLRRAMNESDNKANTKALDSLLNYETVKYFNNEDHEARRYDEALKTYEHAAVKSRVSLSFLNGGQVVLLSLGLVSIMALAAYEVRQGTMTVGDFVMVNTYLMQLAMPLNFLGTVYREIKQSLMDLETMLTLLAEPAEIEDKKKAQKLDVERGEIIFDKVSFAYDVRRSILKDVSFTVPPGSTIAVVGESGAGKSTITRLLYRFYDVSAGAITIDGQDLRNVTQKSLREAIGIVPQDTVLFNDTIAYNIAYGRPNCSRDKIIKAAQLARIESFIESLPDGFDTVVGERGLKLSGGEKQRVAIARMILKNPPILIFDEATSALDTRTEKNIQQNLRELAVGRTAVIIAHRLSTVKDADKILVMQAGRIYEQGKHTDLLKQGGLYTQMWARQAAEEPTPV